MRGKKRQSRAVELYGIDLRPSYWAACVLASMFIHLAAIGVVVYSPWAGSETEWIRPGDTIEVDLVSFNPEVPAPPGGGSGEEAPEDAAAVAAGNVDKKVDTGEESSADEQDSDAVTIPVKKGFKKDVAKDYDLKTPTPPVKSSLKKKTFDSEKVIADAVSRMERETQRQQPKSVQDRIARLEGELADKDYSSRLKDRASGRSGGAPSDDISPIEIYQAEVAVLMKQNWAFSRQMAGGDTGGLETRIVIKIMPDGEISDVWFEKRSGNEYLDESAYRTVMKAGPLPPLPEGFPRYHLVLGFTPSGLAP
ncbi:MAG: TonB family protein [Desulfobacteraceae bacterium]|nr:TonB family protein [Desulfobacteraceae bacterium]MCF8096041.1 TonB family protein [Desulfobacteraceae bacterium]